MDRMLAKTLMALGGAAIAVGALLPWIAARSTRPQLSMAQTPFMDVLHWHYSSSSDFVTSFAVVTLVLGLVALVGGALASRAVTIAGAVLALVAGGLYVALKNYQYNPIDMPYSDLRIGAWLVAIGGVVAIVAACWKRHDEQ